MSEENKNEEVIEEEVVTEEETTEEESAISEEVTNAMDAFDKKMDGEEDDSTEDDTSEEEEVAAEEKNSGDDEVVVEKTAEDKAIEEAVKAIEAEDLDAKAKLEAEKLVEAKTDEVEKEKYVSDLDPEEWDDDAIKADTERGQKHLDEINVEKARNVELQADVQRLANTEHTNWFDRRIALLGEDFHETLGVGDFEDIEPGSPEMDNRGKIDNKMRILTQAYQKAGKPVPSRNKLFEKAVSYEFETIKNKSKNEKATVKKLEERAAQTIGKGSTKSSAISAQKAIQANKDFDAKIDD